MSTQGTQISQSSAETGAASAATAESQTSATQRKLEEIQLARLGAKLRDLDSTRDVVRALGDDPDKYAGRLAKQYDQLALKRRQPPSLVVKKLPSGLAADLDKLADIFNWWESVIAPNATVGLTVTPGPPNTGGVGIGAEIFQGSLALGGEVWNAVLEEQWWVNTWRYIVPLPPTPSTFPNGASLSYRFNVGADLALYRQDVITGSVHVYATVATTGDLSNHPIDFNNPASSDFAIAATLPTASVPPILGGTAKVSGTIPLSPGGTPAIGIIIGLIISVADGDVQIIPGEYSLINIAPPDATTAADIGKIEYRRDQTFWVEAVAQRFAF